MDWFVKKKKDQPVYLESFSHGNKAIRPKAQKGELITKVKSIRWGEKHGVLLDMKGRVFTMGESSKGRLGLPDEQLPEQVLQPR